MDTYWDSYADGGEVRMEDWKLHTNATPYTAPEAICQWLTGRVYGHPHHQDGKLVSTTEIVSRRKNRVSTRNTDYILGAEISDAH